MTVEIRASGALNRDTFETSGRLIEDGEEALVIDLRRCFFTDIYGMVAMLTVATLWVEDELPVSLKLPSAKSSVSIYMARMHFFEQLPAAVECDGSYPIVEEKESWLVPLTPLNESSQEHGVEELSNFAYEQLPRRFAESFTTALSEIGGNVVNHSEAKVGFVAGQRYENNYQGRTPPRLQLMVADAGIGIKASLAAAHPEIEAENDIYAIHRALEWGMTGKPKIHSGVGLPTVAEFVAPFDGLLRIRSGTGTVVVRRKRTQEKVVPGLPGTFVLVELSSPGRR